jgi:hypothetical protein
VKRETQAEDLRRFRLTKKVIADGVPAEPRDDLALRDGHGKHAS